MHIYHQSYLKILIVLLVVFASGCQPVTPTNTPTTIPLIDPPTRTPTRVQNTATQTPTATLTATPSPTTTPTATPLPVRYGPSDFPANINPLTGLEVADSAILERRPVAVKINLVPRTTYRPPWGVSLADIVWEYYHNDGYSRLHAIFYGHDAELAGAIRSGRLPDHDLILMYKSNFAYGSADSLVNFRLLNAVYSDRTVLEGVYSNCPPTEEHPMCRTKDSELLLTGTDAITQYIINQGIDNSKQNLDGMTFDELSPQGGTDADEIIVRYSKDNYSKWEYDPEKGKYNALFDGIYALERTDEVFTPLEDQVTENPVQVDNVVILVAQHQFYQPPPNEIVEILLNSTGKAYAMRDGMLYEVTWNRPTLSSVLYLTFPDGERYAYKPGTTWYQVIGETSIIEYDSVGGWQFNFKFP